MKTEDWLNRVIKRITIKHLVIFSILNLIIFSSTYYFFKKQPVKTDNLSTVNLVIPLYTGVGLGSYIKILNSRKLTNEFELLTYH